MDDVDGAKPTVTGIILKALSQFARDLSGMDETYMHACGLSGEGSRGKANAVQRGLHKTGWGGEQEKGGNCLDESRILRRLCF